MPIISILNHVILLSTLGCAELNPMKANGGVLWAALLLQQIKLYRILHIAPINTGHGVHPRHNCGHLTSQFFQTSGSVWPLLWISCTSARSVSRELGLMNGRGLSEPNSSASGHRPLRGGYRERLRETERKS